jgi:hypothetical protein
MCTPQGTWRRGELKGTRNQPVNHATILAVDEWLRSQWEAME